MLFELECIKWSEHIPSPRLCRHFLPLLGVQGLSCSHPEPSPGGVTGWAGAGTQSRIPQIHGDCTDPWGMHSWLYFLVLQALPASPSPFPADDPWVSSADLPLLFTASVSVPSLPNSNSLFQTPWEAQGIPNLLKSQAWRYWKLLGC